MRVGINHKTLSGRTIAHVVIALFFTLLGDHSLAQEGGWTEFEERCFNVDSAWDFSKVKGEPGREEVWCETGLSQSVRSGMFTHPCWVTDTGQGMLIETDLENRRYRCSKFGFSPQIPEAPEFDSPEMLANRIISNCLEPLSIPKDTAPEDDKSNLLAFRFCVSNEDGRFGSAETANGDQEFFLEAVLAPGFSEDVALYGLAARLRSTSGSVSEFWLLPPSDSSLEGVLVSNRFIARDFESPDGEEVTLYGAADTLLDTLLIGGEKDQAIQLSLTGPVEGLRFGRAQELTIEVSGADATNEQPKMLEILLEGRAHYDPDATFTRDTIELVDVPQQSDCRVESIDRETKKPGPRRILCPLPEGDESAFTVFVQSPEVTDLYWELAVFDGQTGAEPLAEEKGTIKQPDTPKTGLTEDELPPDPVIVSVVPIHPQLGRNGFGQLINHYPESPNASASGFDQYRYLLVLGRDLPERNRDAILSNDDGISYYLRDSIETLSEREWDSSMIATGLRRVFGDKVDAGAVIRGLRARGSSALILEATLPDGVLPGEKEFVLNGAKAQWLLQFADAAVEFGFLRKVAGNEAEGIDPLEEEIADAYPGQEVFVQARVHPVEMDLPSIPVTLTAHEDGQQRYLRTELLMKEAPGLYRSGPLFISGTPDAPGPDAPGQDGAITIALSDQVYNGLRAEVDPEFGIDFMPFALEQGSLLSISSPPEVLAWDRYVMLAAQCSGYETRGADLAELAFKPLVYEDDDPLANTIILNGFETVTQDPRVGHHAGVLFLRQAFLRQASVQEEMFDRMLAHPALLNQRYAAWRDAYSNPFRPRPMDTLFLLRVPAAPLPGSVKFGDLIRFDIDFRKDLEAIGMSDEDIVAWIESRSRLAVEQLLTALRDTMRELVQTKDCDLAPLLEFAKGLQAVGDGAQASLVRRSDRSGPWQPDRRARMWVRSAISLAETWDRQKKASEEDTEMALLVAAVLTLPLHLAEATIVTAVVFAIEATDVAVSSARVYGKYEASQREVARSLGMSPVIGDVRYRSALNNRVSGWGTLAEIGVNVAFMGLDGYDLVKAARVRSAGDSISSGLRRVTDEEREELVRYGQDLQLRSTRDGGLTEVETDHLARLEAAGLVKRSDGPGALRTDPDPFDNSARLNPDDRDADPFGVDGAGRRTPGTQPSASTPGSFTPEPIHSRPAGSYETKLSDEQLRLIHHLGKNDDGIPMLIRLTDNIDGGSRRIPESPTPAAQRLTDRVDAQLEVIVAHFPPTSREHIFAQQALQALRDPSLSLRYTRKLQGAGSTKINKDILGNYIIEMNPLNYVGQEIFGVAWETLAVFAHEAAHMAQGLFQDLTGIVVGRSLREFDSTMRMALIQNALAEATGTGQRITSKEALDISIFYSLEVQLGSFEALSRRAPRFNDPDQFHDGLFQFHHNEVLDRARIYFPDLSDREILEVYVRRNRDRFASLSPDLMLNPMTQKNNFVERYRQMIEDAELALAQLP